MILTLGVGKPLHPDLALLRTCKTVCQEARTIVPQNAQLLAMTFSMPYIAIPTGLWEAYIPRVREISFDNSDFRLQAPDLEFLSHATSLRTLHIGHTSVEHDFTRPEVYQSPRNWRPSDKVGTRPQKDWWNGMRIDLVTRCKYLPPTSIPFMVLQMPWLYDFLENKDPRLSLYGTSVPLW